MVTLIAQFFWEFKLHCKSRENGTSIGVFHLHENSNSVKLGAPRTNIWYKCTGLALISKTLFQKLRILESIIERFHDRGFLVSPLHFVCKQLDILFSNKITMGPKTDLCHSVSAFLGAGEAPTPMVRTLQCTRSFVYKVKKKKKVQSSPGRLITKPGQW